MVKCAALLLGIYLFMTLPAFSQTKNARINKTLKILSKKQEDCLGEGANMSSCWYEYAESLKELLEKEYADLRNRCNEEQKKNLTNEQIKWTMKMKKDVDDFQKMAVKEAGMYTEIVDLRVAGEIAVHTEERLIQIVNATPEDYSNENYKKRKP